MSSIKSPSKNLKKFKFSFSQTLNSLQNLEIFYGILIVIGGILLVAFLRSLTTFFHELGHAIPALLFAENGKVRVYVGSYGDITRSLQFSLGRMEMFIKFNLFDWKMGMCSHPAVKGFWQNFLVIIGGPIASLVIASAALFWMVRGELSDNWIFVAAAFMLAAGIDFFTNIIPNETPVNFHDDSVRYSDGQQLVRLFSRRGLPEEYFRAERFFYQKKYDEADEILKKLIDSGFRQKTTLQLAVKVLIAKKDNLGALEIFGDLQKVKKLNSEDFLLIGQLYFELGQPDTALKHLNQSIYLHYANPAALSIRGSIFTRQKKLETRRTRSPRCPALPTQFCESVPQPRPTFH